MYDEYKVAKEFWTNLSNYPNYPNTLRRRLIDTNYVVSKVYNSLAVVDLGCGDGSLLLSLREFTKIIDFYGFDLSERLINNLICKWGTWPGLHAHVVNLTELTYLPKVEFVLSMGSFPYIFDDNDLINLLKIIDCNNLIARAPCTLKAQDELINKFSNDLCANYAAKYRTVDSYKSIFMSHFDKVDVSRAYPDKIESKYGTKHFFFDCKMQRH